MIPERYNTSTIYWKDLTFEYISLSGTQLHSNTYRNHTLLIIYAGEAIIQNGTETYTLNPGEAMFIRCGTYVNITGNGRDPEQFRAITWGLGWDFLREFYILMPKTNTISLCGTMNDSLVKIPSTVYMKSLYISLIPYIRINSKPSTPLLCVKSQEAVHCLISSDKRLYSCLFDPLYMLKTPGCQCLN